MSVNLWLQPAVVAEYAAGFGVRLRRAFRGHTRHTGTAAEIVRTCVERCWNGRSYVASPGHFNMFWTRDMSFSSTALVRLGDTERARLHASLAWALDTWATRGTHVTTTIHYFAKPSDVYDYGVDSLPLLLAALRAVDATDLVDKHRDWLTREIDHFADMVVDPLTGLVRADRKFSAHRDTVVNRSNAYGNAMVALLAKTIAETGWFDSPIERHFRGDYGRLLMKHFWIGDRFIDALGEPETTSGEANVWPFWTGVVDDVNVMRKAFRTLRREGYANPYPLRYETRRRPEIEVWLTRHLLPDYQGSTVWTSLGAMYLQLLRVVDPQVAAVEIRRYVEWIERDGTFWEVMSTDGECWVSPRWVMIGEESMLWGSIFLDLLENPTLQPATLSPSRSLVLPEIAAVELAVEDEVAA